MKGDLHCLARMKTNFYEFFVFCDFDGVCAKFLPKPCWYTKQGLPYVSRQFHIIQLRQLLFLWNDLYDRHQSNSTSRCWFFERAACVFRIFIFSSPFFFGLCYTKSIFKVLVIRITCSKMRLFWICLLCRLLRSLHRK